MTRLLQKRHQVCLDSWVWCGFSQTANSPNLGSGFGTTEYRETIWCVLWCLRHRFGRCSDVGRPSHCIYLSTTSEAWGELSNAWLRTRGSCSCFESLATLSVRQYLQYLYWP
jgi:hypothetical protein